MPCRSQQVPQAKPVAPAGSSVAQKRPAPEDDDDAAPDIEEVGEISGPPKKKKKKKDKHRERKESVASENPGDGAEPSTSGVTKAEEEKPEVSEVPEEKEKEERKEVSIGEI